MGRDGTDLISNTGRRDEINAQVRQQHGTRRDKGAAEWEEEVEGRAGGLRRRVDGRGK